MQPLSNHEEPTGGVPDLSTRTWRHPSEVAAAEAALAAGPDSMSLNPTNDTRRRPHYLVGMLLVAALCGSGLILGGVLEPGRSLSEKPAPGEQPRRGFDRSAAAATNPRSFIPGGDNYVSPRVFDLNNDFVAQFVFSDGAVFTSASALGDLTEVVLSLGGDHNPVSATVDRVAPEQDIAVLRPAKPLPHDGSPVGAPTEIDDTVVMQDCSDTATNMTGHVQASASSTLTITGEQLTGLVSTSLPTLPCGAGSPVFKDNKLIGMAVNSDSSMTFVAPLHTLLRV